MLSIDLIDVITSKTTWKSQNDDRKRLTEEDWGDKRNCRQKIADEFKWVQEDVKTLYNLL